MQTTAPHSGDCLNELSSTDLRYIGNQWFAKYKESKGYDNMRKCLHRAIEWYEKSRDAAGKHEYDGLSSANKNLGVCYAFLEQMESRRETELYYLKHAARCRAKALEFGELAKKPQKWLQDIMLDLEGTVNLFIDRSKGLVEDSIEEIVQCVRIEVQCPRYHQIMCEHRLNQGERILATCMQYVGERDYKTALPVLRGMHFTIEEARRHAKKNKEIMREVLILEEEIVSFTTLAEGLQSYSLGSEMLDKIRQTGSSRQREDYGFIALDQLKQCDILARGQDVELVAMAQSKLGFTLLQAFNFKDRAQLCFREAISLSATIVGNVHNRHWYQKLTTEMQRLRDEAERIENEKWENRRKPYLEQLKKELEQIWNIKYDTTDAIIEFLWNNFPPKHNENARKPDSELSEKKRLLKMNQVYHPDRVDEEEFGTAYKVLCEEIAKLVNNKYNSIKLEE